MARRSIPAKTSSIPNAAIPSAAIVTRQLEFDRETVGKYLRQQLSEAKPAKLPTGSAGSKPATFSGLPGRDSKPASNLPTGSAVRRKTKSAESSSVTVEATCES